MKVTGTGPNSTDKAREIAGTGSAGRVNTGKDKRRTEVAPQVESGVSDKVAISNRAKDAAKAKELARTAPDVDEAKVAKLKAAIQGGNYQVDADKIADKLLDDHLFNSI